jgi:hypothetical protein
MRGFYVKRIVAKSPTKDDAVVSFGPKLNIIEGHSNTGKTCLQMYRLRVWRVNEKTVQRILWL